MTSSKEEQIIKSWASNAAPWISAVQGGDIASRVLVTDQAVVDVVLLTNPQRVLDIGCGEGWLVRALTGRGVDALGIDAIPALVHSAQAGGVGRFMCLRYADLSQARLPGDFNVVVCNFSLFGKESVEHVFSVVPSLLGKGGRLVVQTLNPAAYPDAEEGWRAGSWEGFGPDFRNPAPWYFRPLASWRDLFDRHGFKEPEIRETEHPETKAPLSLLLSATQDSS